MAGPRTHAALAILFAGVLPALSALSDRGGMAFTMFSRSDTYRLRVTATDGAGLARAVAPTALAAHAGGSIGGVVAGTEQWRHGPYGPLLRRHLAQLASIGCDARPEAARVEVILDQRRTLDAAAESHRGFVTCRR